MFYLNPTTSSYRYVGYHCYYTSQTGAKDEYYNNNNLWVQWDLIDFYPSVLDVHNIMQ